MSEAWTPEQFWEYVEGLTDAFDRDVMCNMLRDRGLAITPAVAATSWCGYCVNTGKVGRRYAPDWKLVEEPCPKCAAAPQVQDGKPDTTRLPPPRNAKPWLTGKPYYCNSCGLGGGEVSACEDGPCEMETEAEAIERRDAAVSRPQQPAIEKPDGDQS